jgi:hypothetical protein
MPVCWLGVISREPSAPVHDFMCIEESSPAAVHIPVAPFCTGELAGMHVSFSFLVCMYPSAFRLESIRCTRRPLPQSAHLCFLVACFHVCAIRLCAPILACRASAHPSCSAVLVEFAAARHYQVPNSPSTISRQCARTRCRTCIVMHVWFLNMAMHVWFININPHETFIACGLHISLC